MKQGAANYLRLEEIFANLEIVPRVKKMMPSKITAKFLFCARGTLAVVWDTL